MPKLIILIQKSILELPIIIRSILSLGSKLATIGFLVPNGSSVMSTIKLRILEPNHYFNIWKITIRELGCLIIELNQSTSTATLIGLIMQFIIKLIATTIQ